MCGKNIIHIYHISGMPTTSLTAMHLIIIIHRRSILYTPQAT